MWHNAFGCASPDHSKALAVGVDDDRWENPAPEGRHKKSTQARAPVLHEFLMAYTVPKLDDYSDESLNRAFNEAYAALDSEIEAVMQEAAQLSPIETLNRKKAIRDRWLARKNGLISQINELWLQAAPPDKKRAAGIAFHKIDAHVNTRLDDLRQLQFFAKHPLESESLDVTLPGIRRPLGAEHPVLKTMNEIVGVFRAMGYSVADGPEIETDYLNFEALNFPPNHPARDTQDTLFVAGQEKKPQLDRLLLRPHTSPVQIP